MKEAKEKDRILNYLFQKGVNPTYSGEISEKLTIPHSSVYTHCMSLKEDGNVFAMKQSIDNLKIDGYYQCEVIISHKGNHFVRTTSYVKKRRSELAENFPKRYWWLIAIFSFMVGFFSDMIKEKFKDNKKQETPLITLPKPSISNKNQ